MKKLLNILSIVLLSSAIIPKLSHTEFVGPIHERIEKTLILIK